MSGLQWRKTQPAVPANVDAAEESNTGEPGNVAVCAMVNALVVARHNHDVRVHGRELRSPRSGATACRGPWGPSRLIRLAL